MNNRVLPSDGQIEQAGISVTFVYPCIIIMSRQRGESISVRPCVRLFLSLSVLKLT